MTSSKNITLVLVLGVFLLLFGAVALFGFGVAVKAPVVIETGPTEEVDLQGEVKMTGQPACLPYPDDGQMHTMECVYGLKVGDKYYALDLGSFTVDFESLDTLSIEGTFVPLEALSSDQWQKYDIEGVVAVTAVITD